MKWKSDKQKRHLIVLLMVISQFMLAAFVFYWLSGQYKIEKNRLAGILYNSYYTAYYYVVDRQIRDNFIDPLLNNGNSPGVRNTIYNLGLTTEVKDQISKSILELLNENEEHLEDFFESYQLVYNKERSYFVENPSENMKRNIRSMIHRSGIRFFENKNDTSYSYYFPFDTYLFKESFKKYLEQGDLNFNLRWQDSTTQIDTTKIHIRRYFGLTMPDISFSKYNFYLLKKIWPQLFFVIVLIALSTFALIFTFRSLIKQIQLNTLRNDFINNITHELKIPVATAKVALEALRNFGIKSNPETTEEYLKLVSKEMNRLDRLTAKVLEHSKLEKTEKFLDKKEIELNIFVDNILKGMHLNFKEKKAKVNFYNAGQDVLLNIDPLYIESIVSNLIDNSLKYSNGEPEIEIEIMSNKKWVFVLVSDNGPGIPEDYINKVFDKFFRVPKGDQHNVKGFGLGLSFAQLVMKQHQGEISVQNNKDKGCTFTLKFPKV